MTIDSFSRHIGYVHSELMQVELRHTVPELDSGWPGFRGMPPVFATAMMVGFIEQTCIRAIQGSLTKGLGTVGVKVDVSHIAATPVGGTVTAEVELLEVLGRKLRFRVACRDSAGLVGEGFHERAVIDVDRFIERANARASNVQTLSKP